MEFTPRSGSGRFFLEPEQKAAASTSSASGSGGGGGGFRWQPEGGSGSGGGGGEEGAAEVVEKEHMFDKVVTPSDVGKLNRLVIPKQHAEKYFPLDAAANEKGLLLSFEDRGGKPWRFRYSYWNSSQSYVMTKGWSRFVKEKRLDAGDTVSFGRGVGEAARGRLFIDWRRRPDAAREVVLLPQHRVPLPSVPFGPWTTAASGGRLLIPTQPMAAASYYDHHHRRHSVAYDYGVAAGRQVLFIRPPPQPPVVQPPMVLNSVPIMSSHFASAAAPAGLATVSSKRVRLFGVNLDCPDADIGDASHGMGTAASRMRMAPVLQLPPCGSSGRTESPTPSPSSSTSAKERCSLDLDL